MYPARILTAASRTARIARVPYGDFAPLALDVAQVYFSHHFMQSRSGWSSASGRTPHGLPSVQHGRYWPYGNLSLPAHLVPSGVDGS
jgi:hypothetical protein